MADYGPPLPPPPPIHDPQRIAGRHVGSGREDGPNRVLGLPNMVEPLLTRVGQGLGYDADQIIIDHGGKATMCAAAVLMSAPGR